jgi:hypothetical protein
MKMESGLKHFSPQGMHISDSVNKTEHRKMRDMYEVMDRWALGLLLMAMALIGTYCSRLQGGCCHIGKISSSMRR